MCEPMTFILGIIVFIAGLAIACKALEKMNCQRDIGIFFRLCCTVVFGLLVIIGSLPLLLSADAFCI